MMDGISNTDACFGDKKDFGSDKRHFLVVVHCTHVLRMVTLRTALMFSIKLVVNTHRIVKLLTF